MRPCLRLDPPSFPHFITCDYSTDDCRQTAPSTHGGRRRQRSTVEVDLPFGEALQDLLERDPPLQPGQRRAQAIVGTDAEGQMLARLAVNVENIAVRRELAGVSVWRARE